MRTLTARLIVTGALCLGFSSSTLAGTVAFQFAFSQLSYEATPGGTTVLPLYLEAVGADSVAFLNQQQGLFSVGLDVARIGGSQPAAYFFGGSGAVSVDGTQFADAGDPIFGPVVGVGPGGSSANLLAFAPFVGASGESISPSLTRILIGTFSVSIAPDATGTALFEARDISDLDDTVSWLDAIVLDGEISPGRTTIHIAQEGVIVPLPTSGSLAAAGLMAGTGMLFGRRRYAD